jgi:hypothetical protein
MAIVETFPQIKETMVSRYLITRMGFWNAVRQGRYNIQDDTY